MCPHCFEDLNEMQGKNALRNCQYKYTIMLELTSKFKKKNTYKLGLVLTLIITQLPRTLETVLLKIYNTLFGDSELKHRKFSFFITRHWISFLYLHSALFSTSGNSSEQKYFLTRPLHHTQVSGSASAFMSISFCPDNMPSFPPSLQMTKRAFLVFFYLNIWLQYLFELVEGLL